MLQFMSMDASCKMSTVHHMFTMNNILLLSLLSRTIKRFPTSNYNPLGSLQENALEKATDQTKDEPKIAYCAQQLFPKGEEKQL
nr:hypothetical protein BgiMline_030517 [Biomphalaria glabrata]